jgi:dienelactone hydrolase
MFFRIIIICAAITPLLAAGVEENLLNRALNERIEFIRPGMGIEYETTIFKPDGAGPFPLAVINHGKDFGDARFQPRARYIVATRELVRRGYVVALPMRGGFSKSSGMYLDGGCNIEGNGKYSAGQLRAALDWLVKQTYVDRSRIVIIGQSHGGLTAMAFAAEPYEGVRGVVNFAGGLKLTSNQCFSWEQSLVNAFRGFGAATGIPSLWFYGENDS